MTSQSLASQNNKDYELRHMKKSRAAQRSTAKFSRRGMFRSEVSTGLLHSRSVTTAKHLVLSISASSSSSEMIPLLHFMYIYRISIFIIKYSSYPIRRLWTLGVCRVAQPLFFLRLVEGTETKSHV